VEPNEAVFADEGFSENVSFYMIKLWPTKFIESTRPDIHRKIIYFEGISAIMNNQLENNLRGYVSMTSEGEVYWELVISIFSPSDYVPRPAETEAEVRSSMSRSTVLSTPYGGAYKLADLDRPWG
jgi:hypothetical protein